MRPVKTRRIGPGAYQVSDGRSAVEVVRNNELVGPDKWMAYAGWDRFCYTDPVATKAEAVECARAMIRDRDLPSDPK